MAGSDRHAELDAWVLATAPRALAYATSLVRDRDKAEDIVQDCYCRLLQKSATYDLARNGLKILLKAITNASINQLSREKRHVSLDAANGSRDGVAVVVADKSATRPVTSSCTASWKKQWTKA